jgi:integrase
VTLATVGGDLSTSASWLEQVAAALRPEFSGGVILASAGGVALTGSACVVSHCPRAGTLGGLCAAHDHRWRKAGRPPVEMWVVSAPPRLKGALPLRPCDAAGCRRGRFQAGLCQTHLLRWKAAGRPELEAWNADGSGPLLRPMPVCHMPGCELHGEGRVGLCRSHEARWARHGRRPLEEFIVECDTFGLDRFDLRALPPVMRAEFAYGLQRRADEQRTQTRPDMLGRLLARLPAGVESLRERSGEEWLEVFGWSEVFNTARRFLVDTLAWLEDLAIGVGWDSEFVRDIWQLRRLGYPHRDRRIRFELIEAAWLRQLTKRWARWRLSTGTSPASVCAGVVAIGALAQGFPQLQRGPQALTRDLVERHLAQLSVRYPHPKTRSGHISAIAGLLRTARQHGWEPRLPAGTDIYREDYPRLEEPAPRAISEAVMVQLEAPATLERFADPQARVIAAILMGTGLRVSDGCQLAVDCLVYDQHGAPYLRYRNHKMRRDALVPIDEALAASVAAQQHAIRLRFPDTAHLVVREQRNPGGVLAFSADTFRHRLAAWLADCDIRDELGRPATVTPHQWRHTYATRLINSDVPQEVVRRLLDHTTHHMTAHYARLSQQTIRAKWEAARKIDVHGREVSPPEGPLADAEWMKNNLARAKMALPNGYCALPLQQRCEYANACLTCPMFVTTAEFLPEHRSQLESTRALIARGEASGQARLVEMNQTVEHNLLTIIATLEADSGCGGGRMGCDCADGEAAGAG